MSEKPRENPEPTKQNSSALFAAIGGNDWRSFMLLLNSNADLNARGPGGITPLMSAIEHNNRKVYLHLLSLNNIDFGAVDDNGQSALALAIKKGNRMVAMSLQSKGVK